MARVARGRASVGTLGGAPKGHALVGARARAQVELREPGRAASSQRELEAAHGCCQGQGRLHSQSHDTKRQQPDGRQQRAHAGRPRKVQAGSCGVCALGPAEARKRLSLSRCSSPLTPGAAPSRACLHVHRRDGATGGVLLSMLRTKLHSHARAALVVRVRQKPETRASAERVLDWTIFDTERVSACCYSLCVRAQRLVEAARWRTSRLPQQRSRCLLPRLLHR